MAGGGSQTSTVHQSNLPEYAEPYYTELMDRALAESTRPYQPYENQRLAGMSGSTAAGLGMAEQYARSDTGLGQAGQRAGAVYDRAMGVGDYTPQDITSGYQGRDFNAERLGYGTGNVNELDVAQFDAAARDQYMSPYMQAVTDHAKQQAVRNAQEEAVYRDSQAATAGAFGGSRAAVQQQMANNALQTRLTGLDVEGRQAAFENAQQQFERDRAARFGADSQNQQTALQMAQANQQALLEAQRLGDESRRSAGQMDLTAQEASERFRQSSRELGLQGMLAALQSAQTQGALAGAQDEMMQNRLRTQLGVGQAREDYTQMELDQAYNDFINQRDSERQNLQYLSSILRGVPISANQDITTTQPTNPLAGLLGTGMGIQSLYQMMGQQG